MMHVRIEAELFLAAMKKARRYGGISVVIRALLRKYVAGTVMINDSEALSELVPAMREQR